MTETHSMRLNIDGSSAAKGATVYKNAVNQIIGSTQQMKKVLDGVGASTKTLNSFRDIAKALGEVSRIRIDGASAGNIRALSAALSSFKGPSQASVKNTRSFLNDLAKAQVNTRFAQNLGAISTAMANFKGPSQAGVKNTRSFFRELNQVNVNPRVASQLAAISAAMSNYRGPSSSQAKATSSFFSALASANINPTTANVLSRVAAALATMPNLSAAMAKNLTSVVTALNNLKAPANANQLVGVLRQLTQVLSAAQGASLRMGGGLRQIPFERASSSAIKLTGDMRGLENAMSLSYHMGSQLRVLFGSLTLGQFTKDVYNADISSQRFASTISITATNTDEAARSMASAREIANRFGLDMATVYEEFGKFNTATRLSGVSANDTLYVFEQFGGAMRVMGLEASRQQLVWKALTQIFSKGTVSAEELKQQLGDQLPAVFNMLEDTIRKTTGNAKASLSDLMKEGRVSSQSILALAKTMSSTFGGQMASAMDRMDAKIGRLSNAWFDFQVLVGQSGLSKAIGDVAENLTHILLDEEFQKMAVTIGTKLSAAVRTAGTALEWLMRNAKGALLALGAFMAYRTAANFITLGAAAMQAASNILKVGTASRTAAGMQASSAAASSSTAGIGASAAASSSAIGRMGQVAGSVFSGIVRFLGVAGLAYLAFQNSTISVGNQQIAFGDVAFKVWNDLLGWVRGGIEITSKYFGYFTSWILGYEAEGTTAAKNVGDALRESFSIAGFIDGGLNGFKQIGLATEVTIEAAKRYTVAAKEAYAAGQARPNYHSIWEQTAIDLKAPERSKGISEQKPFSEYVLAAGKAGEEARKNADANFLEIQKTALQRSALLQTPTITPPNISADDLLKDSSKQSKDTYTKALKEAKEATQEFAHAKMFLDAALNSGKINLDQYNKGLEYQSRLLRDSTDPYASLINSIKEENALLQMGSKAQEQERKFREARNALLAKGVELTDKQELALRNLIATQQKLSKETPFKNYVDGIKEFGVATDEVAVKAIDGLADNIADLVATGKADFASLAQSILKEFVKIGLQNLFKNYFGDMFGGKKTAAEQATTGTGFLGEQAAQEATQKAQLKQAKEAFTNTPLRGALDINGQSSTAVDTSAMNLRGSLDVLGQSTTTASTNVDTLATGAVNAAQALNNLAGGTGGVSVNNGAAAAKATNPELMYAPGNVIRQPLGAAAPAFTTPARPEVSAGLGAIGAGSWKEVGNFAAKGAENVDARLRDILQTAAVRSNFNVEAYSGYRPGDSRFHGKGMATDVMLKDLQGNPIGGSAKGGHYQTAEGFRQYEMYAQEARKVQMEKYPEMEKDFRWGGYFGGPKGKYGSLDGMHFDLGGKNLGMGGGSWANGLTAQQRGFYPGIQSVGMGATGMSGKMMALKPQEIIDLKKTLATEVDASLSPKAYNEQASGVVDTILNRRMSGKWGDNITDVVNAKSQFSEINRLGGVQNISDGSLLYGKGQTSSSFVDDYLSRRAAGQASSVGGNLHYANPVYSDPSNQGWINELQGPRLGEGSRLHQHGTAAGFTPVDPNYGIQLPGAGIDPGATGSIQQVNQSLQQLGQTAQTVGQQTQTAAQMEQTSAQTKQASAQTESITAQQAAMSHQQNGQAVMTAGQAAQQASPQFQQAGQSLSTAGQSASTAQGGLSDMTGGLGALLGPLSSVVPGLGQFGGMIMQVLSSLGNSGGMGGGGGLLGLFAEGGMATNPVAFSRAPHFAEGTPNTGSYGRGGIPSVLHPNEAVIPLSRGRKIPVEVNSSTPKSSQGEFAASRQGQNTFNMILNGVKDIDGFNKSKRQMMSTLVSAQERVMRRNG